MRRSGNKKIWILPVLMVLIAVILLVLGSGLMVTPAQAGFSQLNTGWSVSRGDKTETDVKLSSYRLGKSQKGEVIVLEGTLPKARYTAPTVMFKSSLSSVEVQIDGKDVYSFGREYTDAGAFVPKKYNFVSVNDCSVEHDIRISYTLSERNVFDGIYPIYYGEKHILVRDFLQHNRLPIFLGGFFVIYACLLISLGIFLFLCGRKQPALFYSSLLTFLLWLYTYSYNDIFCFISDRDMLFTLMEYFSLYYIPFAISILLYTTHPDLAAMKQKIILMANFFLPSCFWLIHMSGILHINRFVFVIQVMSVAETIIILPSLVKGARNEHKKKLEEGLYIGIDADNYLLMGFILVIIFAILEIVKFNVSRFSETLRGESVFASINYLDLGMLYFVICLFIYYFLNGIDHMNADKIKGQLEGLAYTDALTGLMNRAKCMQYAATLTGVYAVVSLDLDRLKFVNDTYGHLEGDRMISTFSELLKKSFEGASLIGRTGGDEFLVVFEDPSYDECDKCIEELEKEMSEFNKKEEKFTLSASEGYAFSYEVQDGAFEDVYYLADTRMYEVKEAHHA